MVREVIDLTGSSGTDGDDGEDVGKRRRGDEDEDEDEDEDLKLAIALSLRQHEIEREHEQKQNQDWEQGQSKDKDKDQNQNQHRDRAVPNHHPHKDTKHLASLSATASVSTETANEKNKNIPTDPTTTTSSNTLQSLDRRAMEAERLSRLAGKRKREAGDADGDADSLLSGKGAQFLTESRGTGGEAAGLAGRLAGMTSAISPPPLRRKTTTTGPNAMKAVNNGGTKYSSASASTSTSSSTAATTAAAGATTTTTAAALSSPPPPIYPHGKIFKTHAAGYPSTNTISFTDLLSPLPTLKSALLSSYTWDFDWLLPHFSTWLSRINLLLVMHAKHASHRAQLEADFERVKTVRLCFPPMEGLVNCMHSKLMLLFYDGGEEMDGNWRGRCRIVVPTANLVGFDWGVGSVMENMLWVIDLPLLPAGGATDDGGGGGHDVEAMEFRGSLLAFLRAQTVPDAVIDRLRQYNFSGTKEFRFVHTIGGAHGGDSWRDTGLCGLGTAVSSLGLAQEGHIEVDFVTSSVGSLNEEFMRSMYLACQGDDGLTEYTLRNAKVFPAKRLGNSTSNGLAQKTAGSGWKERFRLYFPSQETVTRSNGGPGSAGTICFSEQWWKNPQFPRANMRDCLSVRDGLLMHNKIVFVRTPESSSPSNPGMGVDSTDAMKPWVGWIYVGSANLSESAWGRLVQDKATGKPKLNCRNWECGVMIRADHPPGISSGSNGCHIFDSFAHMVPIPIQLPAMSYETSKLTPWIFGGV